MQRLEDVLGSRINIVLLRYLTAVRGGRSGNEIATRLGLQQSSARQALERLVAAGVVTRTDVGRSAAYVLDRRLAVTRAILIPLFRVEARLRDDLIGEIMLTVREITPHPTAVILFGSLARGARDFRDVDLLCVAECAQDKEAIHDAVAAGFQQTYRRYRVPVSAIVATETELRSPPLASVVTEARRDGWLLLGTAPAVLQRIRTWQPRLLGPPQ